MTIIFLEWCFKKIRHRSSHISTFFYMYAVFYKYIYESCYTWNFTDTLANDGTNHITVLNSERLNSATGPIKVIHGYATPSDTPGKLTVHLETVIFDAPCTYCSIGILDLCIWSFLRRWFYLHIWHFMEITFSSKYQIVKKKVWIYIIAATI